MNAPMKIEAADRLLRLPEVMELAGLSKAMIYRKVKEGSFPAPYKPGGVASRWSQQELADWKAGIRIERDAASICGG